MKSLLLIFLIIVSSCSKNNFDKVEELKTFRILGIYSANPEVAPGDAGINLQLYVSDINGGGRSITLNVEACIDPGISLGAEVNCNHDSTKTTGTYTIDTVNDADLGAANLYTGLATDTFSVNIPAWVHTGRTSREKTNGVGYIIVFSAVVDGKLHKAFKRLLVTNRAVKNSNPTVTSMNLNNVAIATKPRDGDQLELTSGSSETYSFEEIDGSVTTKSESLKVAWYFSEGLVSSPKSDTGEKITFKSDPPNGNMLVLGVLRDERGGIAFDRHVLP